MRRRDFIKRIAGAGAAWPLVARAQQARQVARVGFLGVAPDNPLSAMGYAVFLAELRKLGFTEGQNLVVENRRIDEGPSKAFAGAAELIRSNVDVVVAFGPELALKAAVAASQTVPIVMIAINFDPMAGGYVSNITRPERNITGVVSRAPELAAKQLGLLVEAFPAVKPIAALWEQASADQFEAAQHAAQSLRIELRSHKVENLLISTRRSAPSPRTGRVWCLFYQARLLLLNAPVSPIWRYSTTFRPCLPSITMSRPAG